MQPTQRRILSFIILIAGLAWVFARADRTGASTAGRIPAPQKGFLAPEFALDTPKGEKVTLTDLKGQAVLVNIWATWCVPCQQEMPAIQKIYDEYRSQGFVVLGVNATAQDAPLDVVPFINDHSISFPILLDETGDVARKYNLRSLPSSFFVDRSGVIREVVVGQMAEVLIRTYAEEIIKSPAP